MSIRFLDNETKILFDNPDFRIYRVIPLDRLIELLKTENWAFVTPTLWNDPYERAFLEAEYKYKDEKFFLPIKPEKVDSKIRYNLFSMCFTQIKESEAFWNTYTPKNDGVIIEINGNELKKALENNRKYNVYIGKAIYSDFKKLYNFKFDTVFWTKLKQPIINDEHLSLMLKKREQFDYEKEIRILLIRKERMGRKIAYIEIENTKELILSYKLDPRMGKSLCTFIKETLASQPFNITNKIEQSGLYKKSYRNITFNEPNDII